MKEHQEETKKIGEENKKLSKYKEMDKQENRKTLKPRQKKNLTKILVKQLK